MIIVQLDALPGTDLQFMDSMSWWDPETACVTPRGAAGRIPGSPLVMISGRRSPNDVAESCISESSVDSLNTNSSLAAV